MQGRRSALGGAGRRGGFGGGGGGGPSGPQPSEVDFEWTVKHDIEELAEGNDWPSGAWSDGETVWILDNASGAGDAVYAYDLETGERLEDREFALADSNRAPRGVWSDGETVWVSDSGQERLFAYDLATGERVEERDIVLTRRNRDARGIWSDDVVIWVLNRNPSLFAYDLEDGALPPSTPSMTPTGTRAASGRTGSPSGSPTTARSASSPTACPRRPPSLPRNHWPSSE